MATVVFCNQNPKTEIEEKRMGISERVQDFFLRIFCGGDRSGLAQDLAEANQRIRSLAQLQRETYRNGKEAIRRLQSELRFQEQATTVFEKRVRELERQLAEAEEFSLTDTLTGLLNRRGAVRQLIAEASAVWRSVGSTEQPINKRLACSVVFIDLDNFKPVNDQYGHAKGDEALRVFAKLFRESFPRAGDLIARVGGDEFIVIMTGADIGIAKKRSDNLLRRMANEPGLVFGGTRVGASIGIAPMMLSSPTSGGSLKPEHVLTQLDAAIKEADAAMYLSKNDGKGKVTVSQ